MLALQAEDYTADMQALQGALAFNTELTAANPKALLSSHAMIKGDAYYLCPIEDILVLPDFNVRIKDDAYYAHIRSIADSIKENGFYADKPLTTYGALFEGRNRIFLTDGYCRLEGAQLAISEGAPLSDLPIVQKDKSTSMEDLTVALARSNGGKRLTPPELAVVCKRLTTFGWKPQKIAEKIGITPEYVSQLLTLSGAPSAVREMVQHGQATAATAIEAIREHGDKAGEVLTAALVVAKAAGKEKVTRKFMPNQVRKVTLAKAAPKMLEALTQIKSNQAYSSFPAELQAFIDDLVKSVSESEEPESASNAEDGAVQAGEVQGDLVLDQVS